MSTPPLLDYYRAMLRIRRLEERILALFREGALRGTAHVCIGQEAVAVGACAALSAADLVTSNHRGHGHLLARGGDPRRLLAELFGKETGYALGRGGSQHMAALEIGFLGSNGITAGGLPVAVGAALSLALRRAPAICLAFFGDGATAQGAFHEALNLAALWRLPLLRLDVGRMFSSLVGSSEENIRRAISIAESIAPCVLWVDEIDKAFAAMTGNSTDSGTSQRVLGTFLTWLAEKTSPVFVVATANNLHVLPPELLRKGRFDEIFFVDLPNASEREAIFRIHLQRRQRDPDKYNLRDLAARAEGFSGAEIEQAVVSALFDAYYEKRELADSDIARALAETIPLSKTMEESIKALREWCATRARNASLPQAEAIAETKRRLEIA
ncbi:MAG: thiamine pyrophosphate-dependent enzyme [Planctomycetota bacterium]|nr:thiamine pyrophosphate-dependent enzyme [Planctomycetota bacterium]